ncbi:EscU/YscU/HrcU family type III secretion system export apparatus switch protein [Methylobacillus arboreus]|uniref:EscU/YscU/HrcU family type III secretion system export apparatus switch protein n=1 Tax=Methylobacillus arboreus TaxID=755170 RepID=UPI001E38B5BB|nr:EscU/YscU/HrcU family type III secretion system export apparatus switch protein [Methylobacillus arboreus]MCB5191872.1 EscU/YscU/HrcU family type III secretion system export apparatus switch protein [Methylobacillus arboreus]
MPKKAVGIAYGPGKGLPRVILKAAGEQAEQVISEFERQKPAHRVVENESLASGLFRLPMDGEISADLYQLVALLLVHVYSIEAKLKNGMKHD